MELIVIGENKLKIMMSQGDMERFGLDENEFYLSVTDTRKILDKILQNCPVKTGFETILPSDKILIQLYPEKDGGCELFVTKIELDSECDSKEEDIFMPPLNDERFLLPGTTKKNAESKKIHLTYSFEELDFLIAACKELHKRGFFGKSSFYKGEEGKYFLFISAVKEENEKSPPVSFISEFGELENTDRTSLYLAEYGECIMEKDAVELLGGI